MDYLLQRHAEGEIVTGLLYMHEEATDLHAALNTVETPLTQLGERELVPGAAALEKFNASLRCVALTRATIPGCALYWRILAGIGGLLLLLLIAVAIAISTVDVKSFIGPVQKRVKDATGRDLTVGGGVDLKFSLEPKLVAQDVSLSNPPGAKSPQMLMAKRVEVQFALLPLLHREFQVRSLALIEPRIALETDAKGVGNWDFSSASAPAGAPKPAAPDGTATMGGFFVGDFSITNGMLTYLDGETGKLTTVTIADFGLKARDPQSPVDATLPRQRGRHRDCGRWHARTAGVPGEAADGPIR